MVTGARLKEEIKVRLALLFAVLASVGCSTSYKESGFSGGFSETQLAEDVFTVRFRGNGYTSSERAPDFTLLRSAELALEHGYRFFVIVDSTDEVSTSNFTTPTTTTATANGGYAQATSAGGQAYTIHKPRSQNTIQCFREKPKDQRMAFDATFVQRSIREKWGIAGE